MGCYCTASELTINYPLLLVTFKSCENFIFCSTLHEIQTATNITLVPLNRNGSSHDVCNHRRLRRYSCGWLQTTFFNIFNDSWLHKLWSQHRSETMLPAYWFYLTFKKYPFWSSCLTHLSIHISWDERIHEPTPWQVQDQIMLHNSLKIPKTFSRMNFPVSKILSSEWIRAPCLYICPNFMKGHRTRIGQFGESTMTMPYSGNIATRIG